MRANSGVRLKATRTRDRCSQRQGFQRRSSRSVHSENDSRSEVIESGWWRDVSIRIDAGEGSDLQIDAPDEKRAQILDWIKTIAYAPLPDAYFAWVREVAIHRFDAVRPDLQALTWERDPHGHASRSGNDFCQACSRCRADLF